MKKLWIIGVLLLLCSAMAQAGEIVVKQLSVADFYQLRVYNNFDVVYQQSADSAGLVVVMVAEEDMDKITCESQKGRLVIKYRGIADKEQMQGSVMVYSSALEQVENHGIGSVEVASALSGVKFQAKVIGNGSIVVPQIDYTHVKAKVMTGSGTIQLRGICREAELKVIGTGQIEADDLKAQDVVCRISGSGVIGCHATKTLNAWVTGHGEVYYRGAPMIKKSALGELVVRSLENVE